MTIQEIIEYLNKSCSEDKKVTAENFEEVIFELSNIVKKQNHLLLDIKNSNIRLENKIKYIENELERYRAYKNTLDILLYKIRKNPVSALIYLYKLKFSIERTSEK